MDGMDAVSTATATAFAGLSRSRSRPREWRAEEYQSSLGFVPKLAGRVVEWLGVEGDDKVLDLGCGDGTLDIEIGRVLAKGGGKLLGLDRSASMIKAARENVRRGEVGLERKCLFIVADTSNLLSHAAMVQQPEHFTKVFSSAAIHWMLGEGGSQEGPVSKRGKTFFEGVRYVLKPGGKFVFEMGGMGNIAEARAAMVGVVARALGETPEKIKEPWFFPDEEWVREMLEVKVGGFEVERSEMEWRPTKIDGKGGLEGWVRLIGGQLFYLIGGEKEREEAVREVVRLLEVVCRREPAREGGEVEYVVNYVRLRVVARRL
ncbi:S-adenosyl-L-methionine-dependent methyltransferase [Cercophora samala]|uniref:S-adenosyl-L-methionine-dependent methyltransferase n=1 Tax=Cercophora samala TaxID=330535 RepID=A0AA39ZE71_9PEZI|nr:S-adenosyl-L-methionine-dependent methyltransferase [Cercophora samala]